MSMEKIKNELAPLMMKCAMIGHDWKVYQPRGVLQKTRSCKCCGARQKSTFTVLEPQLPNALPIYREEWIDD